MPVYQLIKNGAVVNTIVADASFFSTPSDDWDSYEEVAPAPPPPAPAPVEPPPAPDIVVSPVEFKLLFTAPERVAIKAERANDPIIDDFFDIIDDPRLTQVNLSLVSTISAINYLASKNLILPERVDQILAGTMQ